MIFNIKGNGNALSDIHLEMEKRFFSVSLNCFTLF